MIFLAEHLRTAYPEARVITMGGDWLFAHEADNPKLRGLLSITTAPLAASWEDSMAVASGSPSHSKHVNRIPPSFLSAAVFDAAEETFTEIKPRTYAAPEMSQGVYIVRDPEEAIAPGLFEYGCPADLTSGCPPGDTGTHPPVMLEAVGRQGYWPVAMLSEANKKADPNHKNPGAPRSTLPLWKGRFEKDPFHPLPLSWRVFVLAAFIAPLIYIILLFAPRYLNLPSLVALKFSSDLIGEFGVAPFFLMALLITGGQLLYVFPVAYLQAQKHPVWVCLSWFLPLLMIALLALDLRERSLELKRRHQPARPLMISLAYLVFAGAMFAAALFTARHYSQSSNFSVYASGKFFFDRYVHLASGLSPVLPFLALVIALLWWLHHCITGLVVLGILRPHLPGSHYGLQSSGPSSDMPDCASFNQFAYMHESLTELKGNLLEPLPWVSALSIPILIGIVLLLFLMRGSHPLLGLEGKWYDWGFFGLFIATNAVILFEIGRLWLMWQQFQNFLVSLDNSLLRRGFSNLRGFRWDPLWSFGAELNDLWKLLTRMHESLSCVQKKSIQTASPLDSECLQKQEKIVTDEFADIRFLFQPRHLRMWLNRKLRAQKKDKPAWTAHMANISEAYQRAAESLLMFLSREWGMESAFINDDRLDGHDEKSAPSEAGLLTREAEQFVCLVYLNSILAIFVRLRSCVTAIAGLFIFILISTHIYPFAAHAAVDAYIVVLFAVIAVAVGVVYAQMHRNATLSRITNSDIGKVGADFYFRMFTFLVLPVISLLAAQFPGFANFLFSWIEPAANALH